MGKPAARGWLRYRWLSALSPLLVLLLWEGAVQYGLLDRRFFPPPSAVLRLLVQMTCSGELLKHLGASLRRIALGFALGVLPGVLVGLLMGWFQGLRALLEPLVAATYPIPKIALLPLILVLFGLGESSKVVTVAVAGFFPALIATTQGAAQVSPVLIQAAQNYGARGWRLLTRVILPASLPFVLTGVRLALGVSLLIVVAAEFVAADRGIGYLVWISWATLSVTRMYVGLLTIALLGLLFTAGLARFSRWLTPWDESSG